MIKKIIQRRLNKDNVFEVAFRKEKFRLGERKKGRAKNITF